MQRASAYFAAFTGMSVLFAGHPPAGSNHPGCGPGGGPAVGQLHGIGVSIGRTEWASRNHRDPRVRSRRVDVLVNASELGVWAFHCHVLTQAEGEDGMFGMVTALIVQEP